MKNVMLYITLALATTFGSCSAGAVDPDMELTPETSEKVKEAQDVNTELEEIDGELDSLLNLLN